MFKLLNKRAEDLTVGESLLISIPITAVSVLVALTPLAIEAIKEKINDKKFKAAVTRDEDGIFHF